MKWLEGVPDPAKSCGSCSMCCKVFEIDWLDKPKPAGKWCHHCKPGSGCVIWQTLPERCAQYHCVWRIDPSLAPEWQPDRARFLLTHAHQDAPLAVILDDGAPDAHRKEPYWTALRNTARDHLEGRGTTIVIFRGKNRSLLFPDGEVPIPEKVQLHEIYIDRYDGPVGPYWKARFPKD